MVFRRTITSYIFKKFIYNLYILKIRNILNLSYCCRQLKSTFRNESTVLTIEKEGKNENKYHDTVIETFFTDYYGTKKVKIPKEYAFPNPPTLMQLYISYKMKENTFFGKSSRVF